MYYHIADTVTGLEGSSLLYRVVKGRKIISRIEQGEMFYCEDIEIDSRERERKT